METHKLKSSKLTQKIIIAMLFGVGIGLLIHSFPRLPLINAYLTEGLLDIGGKVFITFLKMLVVPIVFISLVCGTCNLGSGKKLGRMASKTLGLYIATTAIAITIALFFASLLSIGKGLPINHSVSFNVSEIPSFKTALINIFPSNPVAALASGNMLQIIIFALLFGMAINASGAAGQRVRKLFQDVDVIVLKLMHFIINVAPYGVFCLVATIFAKTGYGLILQLISYFLTVLGVLMIQLLLIYPLMLRYLAKLSPVIFFRKLFPAMLFAFSTSSSNASIPVVLETVEKKLGVKEKIAAFVIPLGATINMDGTAIMQGVATVFIAHAYQVPISLVGYLKIILTATLASIGTAGIPSAGLITLTMVLLQVGLPIQAIGLIIGIDRLLDMTRTAVNISGDSTIACIVANSEQALDVNKFNEVLNEHSA